ncbi:MAG: outer membrane beta-barrel family protein, partial [Prevotellaceae bacterium]|nr:outer membrane beta-barrel family protein [Prevotellaceae bacterium]
SEAQTTFGYNFNKNSNIIIDFQIPLYDKVTMTDIENTTRFINPANNQTDSTINSAGTMITNNYTFNSEVFFKHLFSNSESYFTANMAYINNYTRNIRSFNSFTQVNNVNSTTEDFYTAGSLNYNVLTSKLDFSFPLFGCTVNTGFKLSFIKTSSDNTFFNIINSDKILDPALSNKYNYTENIQSVYYSMEKNIQNWSFKAGLRSEITQTIGNSLITAERHKNSYTDFFPSIYVFHKLNSKSSVSISYAERIERPPYKYLDPFRWYISKHEYGEGNPFLNPSYIKKVELTYILNTFSAEIYYLTQNNRFGRYVVLDSLNILNKIQKTDNFFNVNFYGINVYKLLKLNKWLETALQGSFAYSEYKSNKNEFANIFGIAGAIILNNTIFIKKKFQLVFNLQEKFPGLYNYRSMNNFFQLDIGLNYTPTKSGFAAKLSVTDIFKTSNPEYTYISDGIKQTYRNYYDTRMFRLTLTWKLGNWYNKTSQISSSSNVEEKQRL